MRGRILEISGQPRQIGLNRGFVVVADSRDELGRLDLDGVNSILVTSRGATLTTPLICEAASRNISLIICNEKFQPISVMLPVVSHSDQKRRFEAQVSMRKSVRNRLWSQLVKGKVKNQGRLLQLCQSDSAMRLKRLSEEIRSGDPANIEAQAAQVYWPALFGKEFRRNRYREDVNGMLNYGYAILRSCMLSAILATGLHPTFGIFHSNRNNALCLVDDLMEPYRPIVDQIAHRLYEKGHNNLSDQAKVCFASLVTSDQPGIGGSSPLFQHMTGLSYELVRSISQKGVSLPIPNLLSEIEVAAVVGQC